MTHPPNRQYVIAVYVVAGALLANNLLTLAAGQLAPLLPAAVQIAVLFSVYRRKAWAWMAVSVWAALLIGAGAFKWAAILLRPGPTDEPTLATALLSLLMIFGFYLLVYARRSLQVRLPS